MHKTLVLLLLAPIKKKDQFTSGYTELNAKLLVPSIEDVSLENVFSSSFFFPHQKAVTCLRIKTIHVFDVKELELMWCKLGSTLTAIAIGGNIPLETYTQATFSFSSASVLISGLKYIVTQKASDSYY